MLKKDELSNPASCLNKAHNYERLFVLLARDTAAPATIEFWIAERIRQGLNIADDPEITEALQCAEKMEEYLLELEQEKQERDSQVQ